MISNATTQSIYEQVTTKIPNADVTQHRGLWRKHLVTVTKEVAPSKCNEVDKFGKFVSKKLGSRFSLRLVTKGTKITSRAKSGIPVLSALLVYKGTKK